MNLRSLFVPALAALLFPAAAQAFSLRIQNADTNPLVSAPSVSFDDETLCIAPSIQYAASNARDLWLVAPRSVAFSGSSAQDLRACASSVFIDSFVGQNAAVLASAASFSTNSSIGGDLLVCAKSVVCEGRVEGETRIFASSVSLSGSFGASVHVLADSVALSPSTVINGDLVCSCPTLPVPPKGARILGRIRHAPSGAAAPPASALDAFRHRLYFHGVLFLGAVLVGLPFVGLFPLAAGAAVRSIRLHPWKCLFSGLVAFLAAPFLFILLCFTGIAVPLALVAGAFHLVLLYLSHIVVALWIGHILIGRGRPQVFMVVFRSLSLGLFFLYFLSAVPSVASFLVLPVIFLGLGALVQSIRHPVVFAPPRFPPVPPPPPSAP